MGPQSLDARVVAGKLCLAEGRMNLFVADMVEQHRRCAATAARFGDEVMQGLRHIVRNGAPAQGANRGAFRHFRNFSPAPENFKCITIGDSPCEIAELALLLWAKHHSFT